MRQSNALRFSLRTLLIVITFVAIGCTALLNANEWWAAALYTLYALLFSLAILVAIFRTGATRAACFGFVIWGVVFGAWQFLPYTARLIAYPLNNVVYDQLWPEQPGTNINDPFATTVRPAGAPFATSYVNVANAVWLLLISTIGGWVAWYLYRTAPHADAAQAKPRNP
jgi:hypothetical protein